MELVHLEIIIKILWLNLEALGRVKLQKYLNTIIMFKTKAMFELRANI
jgi:hypothetical protein